MKQHLKFIDLFSGLGGIRIGFEEACHENGYKTECVLTSEIKPHALSIHKHNFKNESVLGDITLIDESEVPDFDFLLAGFPCQAFSTAGKKHGFQDTRGTLFFDVVRILKYKKPTGFILENVEGLVTHDRKNKNSKIGNTLTVILSVLRDLGYHVEWKVLNAKNFGVPQERKRIYIIGHLKHNISLDGFPQMSACYGDIKEHNLPPLNTPFTDRLLELFQPHQLQGKSIKDKRGGNTNIHSWDLELKGKLKPSQKELMRVLLKERRKKHWAISKGITWMDGMPLSLEEIHSFYSYRDIEHLQSDLDDLVEKKYLRFEHPKELIEKNGLKYREYKESSPKGYNIVTGKLSFELNRILGNKCVAPTIVATEADRIGVLDNDKVRRLSTRECLRFFGFPDWYNSNLKDKELFDLVGNTVVVPVIKAISERLIRP